MATFIHGVKVKIIKKMRFKYVLMVYDTGHKVGFDYTLKQWKSILSKFIDYCDTHKIVYQ